MANTLRVEYMMLTSRNSGSTFPSLTGVYNEQTVATGAGTLGGARLVIPPSPGSDMNQFARLTAITGPVKVCSGSNPNATTDAGLRILVASPVIVKVNAGLLIDAIDIT